MRILQSFDELSRELDGRKTCLTIGAFDGVHLGHQLLVQETIAQATALGVASVVITFKNHPLSVLAPPYTPRSLTTFERKCQLIAALGVDYILALEFTEEFAAVDAEDFLQNCLVKQSNVAGIVCGYDFTFGRQGKGNVELLREWQARLGYVVHELQPVSTENRLVKSTQIRDLLYAGHVADAAVLLSRPHEVPGTVQHGAKRGRTIGVPTANLQPPARYLVPKRGVYLCAGRVENDERLYAAMVNIGTSPTFGENEQTVEAHLLGFDREIYGHGVALYFLERLRDERPFPNVEALVSQLTSDRQQSETLWESAAIQQAVAKVPVGLS